MNAHERQRVGDPEAHSATCDAARWLDEHGDIMYRFALARVGHRELAEDLVQDALLAALQSRAQFEGRATVRTWLLSILRYKIIDHRRRMAMPISITDAEQTGSHEPVSGRYFTAGGLWKRSIANWKAPDQALEDREFWGVLDGCLNRLPDSLSSAFILRELEDLDTAELRQILNVSEANLRVRLHRARLLLRECLEKHWFHLSPGKARNNP